MPLYPHKTPITINGVACKIGEGTNSFEEIIDAARNGGVSLTNPTAVTVVSVPTQASSVKGNDSYKIIGGEVLTIA